MKEARNKDEKKKKTRMRRKGKGLKVEWCEDRRGDVVN